MEKKCGFYQTKITHIDDEKLHILTESNYFIQQLQSNTNIYRERMERE